jgi:hypothetical protein
MDFAGVAALAVKVGFRLDGFKGCPAVHFYDFV